MLKVKLSQIRICIIGLGYVGLPLAIAFSKYFSVTGFDLNESRIKDLKNNVDYTNEVTSSILKKSKCSFTSKLSDIKDCNLFIVTVPTPIFANRKPDLGPLKSSSKMIGSIIKKGDTVVFESTVYPGATEEVCAPIIEKGSSLKLNEDFFLGYSPERINPGDKEKKLSNIKKIVSASNKQTLNLLVKVYSKIIKAGIHSTSSIRVAEAAKVIENTQRDLNIAFINELSILFNKLDIDTEEVLKAAETKWNFISFRPGLVGGHCIGVDPYYLTAKAKSIGYDPKIILAGRELNDNMPKIVGKRFIDKTRSLFPKERNLKILILGATFKENCPDTRNSKVESLCNYLVKRDCKIHIFEPNINSKRMFGQSKINSPKKNYYHGIVYAVGHDQFKKYSIKKMRSWSKKGGIIFDLKYSLDQSDADMRL